MRRLTAFALALVLGIAASMGLVSCGGGEDAKLLPGETAREITENLDTVKQFAGEGECIGAADAAEEVGTQIEALDGVDAKLKQALQQGAARLSEVVATCQEATTEAIAPASVPTTEETTKESPGQEKKEEKEKEREEEKAEKEKQAPPPTTTPTETTPTPPPSEGGGTGAPGGVSPAAPAGEGE